MFTSNFVTCGYAGTGIGSNSFRGDCYEKILFHRIVFAAFDLGHVNHVPVKSGCHNGEKSSPIDFESGIDDTTTRRTTNSVSRQK